MDEKLENFFCAQMFNPIYSKEIFATDKEGTSWGSFWRLSFKPDMCLEQKLDEARVSGYKIFVIPSEGKLYDDISRTIHEFDRHGRSATFERYGVMT